MTKKSTNKNKSLFYFLIISVFFAFFTGQCALFDNPKIIEGSPAEFEVVPTVTPSIWVKFSKPMNKRKTEKAFSLSSSYTLPKGTFRWEGDNTLYYDLLSNLDYGGYYSIKINTSAEDVDHNKLVETYMVNFFVGTSRTPPAVVSVSPANLNFNTAPTDVIVVTFSKPMKQKETEQAFSLSPAVSGIFSWSPDSSVMTFTPMELWKFLQTYKITIKTTAQDTNSAVLTPEFVSYFRAGLNYIKPNVLSVRTSSGLDITDGVTNVNNLEKTDSIVVSFDKAMNFSSVQSAFTLVESVSGSIIAGSFTWNATFDQFTFKPNNNLTPEGLYKISLSQKAVDTFGNTLNLPVNINVAIMGVNSRYVTVTSINFNPGILDCTFTGAIAVTPLGGNALEITTPGIINKVTFGQLPLWSCPVEITFSAPMDILTIPGNIIFERIVGTGAGTGVISCGSNSCYNWNAGKTMITILLNDMGNQYGEFIYKLTITGGINGVRDQQVNYLKNTRDVFINPAN